MAVNLNHRHLGQPAGAAPDLVIAHGLFGSASNWQTVARQLAEHFCIALVDLRNHGDSPHSDEMSYAAMAADLAHFVDQHCAGPAFMVGHSMGGKAVMTLGLEYGEKVRALVAADIAPVDRLSGFAAYTRAMQSVPLDQIGSRADADSYLRDVAPEPGVRGFLLQNLRRAEDGGWRWRVNLPVLAKTLPQIGGFPPTNSSYAGPALFLRGADSEYVTDADFSAAKTLFPNARLQTVDNAGHWLHAQQPQEVAQAIADFLT